VTPVELRRWLGRHRVLSAALLAAVVHAVAAGGAGRVPGAWYVIWVAVSLALLAVSLLRVVHRAATTAPPPALQPLAPHAEAFILLVAVNLVLLSPLAPTFESMARALATQPYHNPLVRRAFEAAGHLTASVLALIFAAGLLAVAWLVLLRVLGPALNATPRMRRLGAALDAALVGALLVYAAGGLVLSFNAGFDRGPATVRRGDLVGVASLPVPSTGLILGWADVRYLDSGGVERVLLAPRDDVWPGRARPGLPVSVQVRPGFLGVPWVGGVRVDHERELRRALAAVPTAAALRRSLIRMLQDERRWDEVRVETEAHFRAYPEDTRFVGSIAAALRAGGQHGHAAALDRLAEQP